jgi:cell division protein FtsB
MRWTGLFLLLILILQYRIWFDDTGVVATTHLKHKVQSMKENNNVLKSRNEWLRKDVHNLQTKNDVLEEKAREDLGLVKKSERFYLFLDATK